MAGYGFARDVANDRLDIEVAGTTVAQLTTTAFTLPTGIGLTITSGGVTVTAGGARVLAGRMKETLSLTNFATGGNYAITAAAIAGGLVTRDPNGGARTDTLPTGELLDAEFTSPAMAVGDTVTCMYMNTADAAETITLAVNTGMTIEDVAQTIAENESCYLVFRKTATNTFNCYMIGA